jgi:hypothetical protein
MSSSEFQRNSKGTLDFFFFAPLKTYPALDQNLPGDELMFAHDSKCPESLY